MLTASLRNSTTPISVELLSEFDEVTAPIFGSPDPEVIEVVMGTMMTADVIADQGLGPGTDPGVGIEIGAETGPGIEVGGGIDLDLVTGIGIEDLGAGDVPTADLIREAVGAR
jgi:hypothetical protein